jgi:hypothetical protein
VEIIAGTPMALFAIIVFPIAAYFIANAYKRPTEGALWVFLWGTLFLPESTLIDFALIPAIGKHGLAAGLGIVYLWIRDPKSIRRVPPLRGAESLFLLAAFGAVFQIPGNMEPVIWKAFPDDLVFPALTYKDGVSFALEAVVANYLPFYLGRLVVQSDMDIRGFVKAMVVAGFVYTFPSMIEQALSPQLHNWIYGFHQHDFIQCKRMGGWRPMIFMKHGLVVAQFMLLAAMAALTLLRVNERALKYAPKSLAVYQIVQLVLMKSTGAIIFGAVILPIVAWAKPRAQMTICVVFAVICIAYPLSKLEDFFPGEPLVELAQSIAGKDRADSLETRFRNDAILAERGRERLWWGWGGYDRGQIFNIWGEQETVPDSQWIVAFNRGGLAAVISLFGMLVVPVFSASRVLKKLQAPDARVLLAGLALLNITYAIDLLLNSVQNGFPLVLAGVLDSAARVYNAGLAGAQTERAKFRVPRPRAAEPAAVR